ncbi:MAG: GTP-binding protein, partial [Victivallales bacterium]|nr:GTP-binding protein [Victivallales bacterium]
MSNSKSHSREAERIRNIGIVAHIDAGKTTLTERILYETKEIRTMGEVHDGTTVTDFLPEERERGISITAAAVTCRWKTWQINILDTPGHIDFTGEVERSLAVMDGTVLLLCAVKGVQAQTETVWRRVAKHRLPALAFINKMDRDGADGERVIGQLAARLAIVPLPVQYPVVERGIFLGTVDLLSGRTAVPGPAGRQAMESVGCAQARQNLLERLAENDDSILHDYVAGAWPTETALRRAIRRATMN